MVMDDADTNNLLVLIVAGGSVVAVIVGYLLAWRSKRTTSRKAGSFLTAAVVGFAALCMFFWLMGAVTPFPPPDGSSVWEPVIFFIVFLPLPLGAFYLCARFIRRARRDESKTKPDKTETA